MGGRPPFAGVAEVRTPFPDEVPEGRPFVETEADDLPFADADSDFPLAFVATNVGVNTWFETTYFTGLVTIYITNL